MRIKLKIENEEQRKQVIYALACNQYPVFCENTEMTMIRPAEHYVVVDVYDRKQIEDAEELCRNIMKGLEKYEKRCEVGTSE